VEAAPSEEVQLSLPIKITDKVSTIDRNQTEPDNIRIESGNSDFRLLAGESYKNAQVQIISPRGRLIHTTRLDHRGTAGIDISRSGQGLYILRLNGTSQSTTFRMLVRGENVSLRPGNANHNSVHSPTLASAKEASFSLSVRPHDSDYEDLEDVTIHISEDGAVSTDGDIPVENSTLALILVNIGVVERFKEILDENTYEEIFPNRYGLGETGQKSDGDFDFYTYESLLNAVDEISDIRIEVWLREGVNYAQKIKWFDDGTGESREMITHPDYNADWNLEKPEILSAEFSYADFCNVGSIETRQRELAAFLANISHETTGQGADFFPKTWGLYWIEEVRWQNGSTDLGYRDEGHDVYPPSPGKSYHGRGPIQISWNYNYGQVSEFLFGEKDILLDNPERVIEQDFTGSGRPDATLAFQTAIWFWMYPQAPKPSCHAVMTEQWEPTQEDINAGRDESMFGMTVNIINGGLECNRGDGDYRVRDRAGYYEQYAGIMNIMIEDYLDCGRMQPY
jgi:hypothetical protein